MIRIFNDARGISGTSKTSGAEVHAMTWGTMQGEHNSANTFIQFFSKEVVFGVRRLNPVRLDELCASWLLYRGLIYLPDTKPRVPERRINIATRLNPRACSIELDRSVSVLGFYLLNGTAQIICRAQSNSSGFGVLFPPEVLDAYAQAWLRERQILEE